MTPAQGDGERADVDAGRAPIRYYQQGEAWWAEDDNMPGWTGAHETLAGVIQMHHDAMLVFPLLAEIVALREALGHYDASAPAPHDDAFMAPSGKGVRVSLRKLGSELMKREFGIDVDAARLASEPMDASHELTELRRVKPALATLVAAAMEMRGITRSVGHVVSVCPCVSCLRVHVFDAALAALRAALEGQ